MRRLRRYHPLMRSAGYFCAATAMIISLSACAALSDDMNRAETAYGSARYEDTLIWLRDLEDDAPSMDLEMRARYYYLRGMTEYRLGHRGESLHFLAVAREVAGDGGAGLRPEWRQIMDRTLTELTPRGMNHRPPTDGGTGEVENGDGETSGGEAGESDAEG